MSEAAVEREVEVAGALGLHARPAAEFAARAGQFNCSVVLVKDDHAVDAKSVLLVLTLDVRQGDHVVVRAVGDDAGRAVDELAVLIGRS